MHCVSLINAVFAASRGIDQAVHLCRRNKGRRGWVGEGSYDPIMPALQALDVDQLMMEFTIPVAGDMRCLRALPERVSIGLGCVDCRGEVIDAPETIVARVEHALEHVAKERIVLAPDCGFAPGNAADIPLDEAYEAPQHEPPPRPRCAGIIRRNGEGLRGVSRGTRILRLPKDYAMINSHSRRFESTGRRAARDEPRSNKKIATDRLEAAGPPCSLC